MSETSPFHRPHHIYQALPKVDLHRHIEGSLRLTTLLEAARAGQLKIPEGSGHRTLVHVGETDQRFSNHLPRRIHSLRTFFCSPELIVRFTSEAVADAAADQVRYLELRFTPTAITRMHGFDLGEVMDWVIAGACQAERELGITARLVASIPSSESRRTAGMMLRLAAERRERGIVGVDLAGDAARFDTTGFASLFKEARQAGLHTAFHAGHCSTPASVQTAITRLGAERVACGGAILADAEIAASLRESQTPIEVCLASREPYRAAEQQAKHGLPWLLQQGLNYVLCSGNPGAAGTRLSDGYDLACSQGGVSLPALQERILAAARAAFLTLPESTFLAARLTAELKALRSARFNDHSRALTPPVTMTA